MSGPLVDIIMVASYQRAQPMMAVEASEAFCSGTRRPSGLHKHHRQRAGTDSAITDRSIAANRGFDVFVSLVGCKNTECFPVFEADLMIREDQQGKINHPAGAGHSKRSQAKDRHDHQSLRYRYALHEHCPRSCNCRCVRIGCSSKA